MKHPVRDRILIFLCAVLVAGTAAALVLFSFGMIPQDWVTHALNFMQGGAFNKFLVCACALVMILFSLFLLFIILPGRKKRSMPFALINGDGGNVSISVKALESLVQKCLRTHPELSVVSSSIFSEGENVRITLHITLLEDISIPLAVSALQKEIRQYLQSCAGVEIEDVRVFVDGTTHADEKIMTPYRIAGAIPESKSVSEKAEEPCGEPLKPVVTPSAEAGDVQTPAEESVPAQEQVSFSVSIEPENEPEPEWQTQDDSVLAQDAAQTDWTPNASMPDEEDGEAPEDSEETDETSAGTSELEQSL